MAIWVANSSSSFNSEFPVFLATIQSTPKDGDEKLSIKKGSKVCYIFGYLFGSGGFPLNFKL